MIVQPSCPKLSQSVSPVQKLKQYWLAALRDNIKERDIKKTSCRFAFMSLHWYKNSFVKPYTFIFELNSHIPSHKATESHNNESSVPDSEFLPVISTETSSSRPLRPRFNKLQYTPALALMSQIICHLWFTFFLCVNTSLRAKLLIWQRVLPTRYFFWKSKFGFHTKIFGRWLMGVIYLNQRHF